MESVHLASLQVQYFHFSKFNDLEPGINGWLSNFRGVAILVKKVLILDYISILHVNFLVKILIFKQRLNGKFATCS